MPLVTDPRLDPVINDWVHANGGGRAFPTSYTTLGWYLSPGTLVGGAVFHNSNGVNCFVNLALLPGWNPKGFSRAGLIYSFEQLALRRLTFFITSANLRSIALVTGLGAMHEATLRDAEPEGDLHIYALFPDSCPLWSRIRERRGDRCQATLP